MSGEGGTPPDIVKRRRVYAAGVAAALRLAAAAVALPLFASGCDGVSLREPKKVETLDRRAAEAAQAIGLTLPPSTRIEFAKHEGWIDDAAWLAFVVDDAEWRTLEAQFARADPEALPYSAEAVSHLPADEEGYRPSRQPRLVARQQRWRNGTEAMNIGYAAAGPGKRRVFLLWHQL
ncbi:hypothetical protein ACBY01_05120 [Sphingomonas sp. ac-8]|uniref:hypothetical protein n=1 Tax=Sphingomonas sp. ac-8 TaxID=3242977 RepID=UPI003A806B84